MSDRFSRRAERLMATFSAQAESLGRLKGNSSSKQEIVILQLDVQPGGTAVVAMRSGELGGNP
jgi:hypothetical protein